MLSTVSSLLGRRQTRVNLLLPSQLFFITAFVLLHPVVEAFSRIPILVGGTNTMCCPSFSPSLFCQKIDDMHHTKVSCFDEHQNDVDSSRRQSLIYLLSLLGTAVPSQSSPAFAVVMEDKQAVFKTGKTLGIEDAKARFIEARKSLQYLVDHYEEISKGGGDNVRRYLGTVGTTSAMYGINKVLKELQDEADDIVEFTENMTNFEYSLRGADTSVYSANFVEFSAASTKPEKFFKDAQEEILRMLKYMDAMAVELKLS